MFCNMEGKIKVVWICHLSNEQIHKSLRYSRFYFQKITSVLFHKPIERWNDFAIWNTNAIRQFESFHDIELTVVFPYSGIKGEIQRFDYNGIHYVAFRSEDDTILSIIKTRLCKSYTCTYTKNRRRIASIIKEVQPDIVHVVGAENPYYSIAALDIPDEIPSIVSLQTLMSDPNFVANYPISSKPAYEYRTDLEQQIIKKCRYIGSRVEYFRTIVWNQIKKDAVFLNISLAVGVDIDDRPCEKEYDFVYFAANINKACDYAIEAFALVCAKHPELTLNVSGSYTPDYKAKLDQRLLELGIQGQVFFSGPKATHDDVIKQIKKSRYALLPLKIDLISGTIREAMACGLPVVTTITPATPNLNEDRECVLLSEKGDFLAMANNMLRLIDDENFATTIRQNAIITVRERYCNERYMQLLRQAYYEIYENDKKGKPFSEEIISK